MIYDISKERMKRKKAGPKTASQTKIESNGAVKASDERKHETLRLRTELQALTAITASQVEVLSLIEKLSVSPPVYSEWSTTLESETLSQVTERARGLTKKDISSKPSYCKAVANALMKKAISTHAQVVQLLDLK